MEKDHIIINDKLNSMIGPGTKFKGEFVLDGLLRIDGDFTGEICTTGKVLVGSTGRADCKMQAATVVIGGTVIGEITATEQVIILSTGMVIGNITTPRIVVEEGVILNGCCKISSTVPASPKIKEKIHYESHFRRLIAREQMVVGK